ncbi:NUMOD3 domain-containing DNA-binding protein (plasmid) [Bacillus subtilis]|uniref:NUMOD3 domain-containing DNA-binding protein n=1 Tax=Bacillus subtilis TaxID=1423 RepID=UPI002938DD9A|nr:NUMOD3 domain-containing DNA-binding protein [Bacillus subtilis]WOF33042.1 NUMOD3 domain-containing DNA-binding protein [Bacillus subtilis]
MYVIKNIKNNKCYIGMSMNIERRKSLHFSGLRANRHENERLQNSFNKYGENNFEFEIIIQNDKFTKDELFHLEQMFIKIFNTIDRDIGFNLTLGGKGSLGWKMPKEERQRRAEAYKGEGNPFYGKSHSKESIERKIKNTNYSFTQSKEYRDKISKSMKGKIFSKEHSMNKSIAQKGGKNPSARKISIEGKIYECIQDAVNDLGIKHTTIQYRLKSKSEQFKNWFYID